MIESVGRRHAFARYPIDYTGQGCVEMMKALGVALLIIVLIVPLSAAEKHAGFIPGVITIVTPSNGETISGKEYVFKVGFHSDEKYPISKIQVFLDNEYVNELVFTSPQIQGTCSFKWDTLRTPDGKHRLDVQAVSERTVLGSAGCEVVVNNKTGGLSVPRVALLNPRNGDTVSGIVPIEVKVSDASGEAMVSISIDQSPRLLKNQPPYVYKWDTTREANGPHSVEVTVVDSANNEVNLKPIKLIVSNTKPSAPLAEDGEKPVGAATEVPIPAPPSDVMPSPAVKHTAKVESLRNTAGELKEGVEVAAKLSSESNPSTPIADTPKPNVAETPKELESKTSEPMSTTSGVSALALVARDPDADAPSPGVKVDYRLATPPPAPDENDNCATGKFSSGFEYVVKPGDSVLRLAKRFGVSARAIIDANELEDPAFIRIGDILHIPAPPKLVWIKPVFEHAGGVVMWNGEKREVYAVRPGQDVRLVIGKAVATVNASQVTMDHPAVIQSGRTMVSEHFIKGTLGLDSEK
ncbi:MAG: LysM peptidoglycan-binding domain-containing protein [Armatimonadetes bacterium]|nr:LysM peptidoglycan-binding domain-containing protein [Armatimonadota bacterium]